MPINIQSSPKKEQGKNRTETEMGCNSSKAEPPPLENTMHHHHHADVAEFQKPKTLKQEVVLQIPGCKVHLMDQGEALELAQGHFTIMKIMEQNVALATIIKVGNSVQWPLTKDEPVVKVDALHYLFSLPVKDGGEPLSYGVTFPEQCYGNMEMLDSFLKDHSCFSGLERNKKSDLKWEEFAPRVEDYNHFLARAIAGGTGQIVKGIFLCSNAYTNQVQKGGETILNTAAEKNNGGMVTESMNHRSDATKNNATNDNLKRVRKLTNMTEKLTKSLLDGVGIMSGSVMTPVLKSQPGQAFLNMLPGEVLLASLDAVNRVFEAAEAAEKQTFSATSQAATRMVSNRFGEEAGEATEHVFATAGHAVNTAWNVSKIRKAINPASSANAAGALRNSAKNRNVIY
ncbi:Senescence/dehydration-associated protein, chloroplastic [Glycine max]|nr:Senescence/dehydration-associated protein, chloroplastic [Glycine max]